MSPSPAHLCNSDAHLAYFELAELDDPANVVPSCAKAISLARKRSSVGKQSSLRRIADQTLDCSLHDLS